jgi:hypothetical protein
MRLQLDHKGIGSVEFSQTSSAAAIQHLVTALVIFLLASVERPEAAVTGPKEKAGVTLISEARGAFITG